MEYKQTTERIEYNEDECACPITGQVFDSEAAFDEYIGTRPTTGPDLNLSFADGIKLDTSGYSKAEPVSYWLVARNGKPRDLVREEGNKAISVLETRLNNDSVGKQKKGDTFKRRHFVASEFFPRNDEKYDYFALSHEQFVELSSEDLIRFRPKSEAAAVHGKRHSGNTKRIVLERRETGDSYGHIASVTGVSKKTVIRWCQAAGLA